MVDRMEFPQAAKRLEYEQLKRLKILSIIEATTLVLLVCIAVPLKHMFDWPAGSRILGPVHGIAFLAYIWAVLQTVTGGGWRGRDVARLIIVAFLPFAGYFNVHWLRQRIGKLDDIEHAT